MIKSRPGAPGPLALLARNSYYACPIQDMPIVL
jgi:hypothetical protein